MTENTEFYNIFVTNDRQCTTPALQKNAKITETPQQQLFSAGIKYHLTHPPLQPTVMQIVILIFFKVSLFSPPPAQATIFKCTALKHQMEMMRTLTNLFKHLHSEIVLRHGSQIGLSTHLAPDIAI